MRKKRKKWDKDFKIAIAVSLLIAAIFIVQTYNLKKYSTIQTNEIAEVKTKIQQENERKTKIKKEEQYVGSDEYIKEIGHDTLGLIEEDEIVLKPER